MDRVGRADRYRDRFFDVAAPFGKVVRRACHLEVTHEDFRRARPARRSTRTSEIASSASARGRAAIRGQGQLRREAERVTTPARRGRRPGSRLRTSSSMRSSRRQGRHRRPDRRPQRGRFDDQIAVVEPPRHLQRGAQCLRAGRVTGPALGARQSDEEMRAQPLVGRTLGRDREPGRGRVGVEVDETCVARSLGPDARLLVGVGAVGHAPLRGDGTRGRFVALQHDRDIAVQRGLPVGLDRLQDRPARARSCTKSNDPEPGDVQEAAVDRLIDQQLRRPRRAARHLGQQCEIEVGVRRRRDVQRGAPAGSPRAGDAAEHELTDTHGHVVGSRRRRSAIGLAQHLPEQVRMSVRASA